MPRLHSNEPNAEAIRTSGDTCVASAGSFWSLTVGFITSILSCKPGNCSNLVGPYLPIENPNDLSAGEEYVPSFTIKQIKHATHNFPNSLTISQGMFSKVYDGILKDGTHVAVKCHNKNLYNSDNSVEFQRKIRMLQDVRHPNLVKLYGYLEHHKFSIFVLEFVPNGNLRKHLDSAHGKYLEFEVRLNIAIDVAKAVAYLHDNAYHSPIIHGKLKSTNILLSNTYKAMVSDFGFPPKSGESQFTCSQVISIGYFDPEYSFTGRITEKSDVYSFGVILLELLSGRPPFKGSPESNDFVTTEWATAKFSDGNAIATLDPKMPPVETTSVVIESLLELTIRCLDFNGSKWPTMRNCTDILMKIREDYKKHV